MDWPLLLQITLSLGALTLFAFALRDTTAPPPETDDWANRNSW